MSPGQSAAFATPAEDRLAHVQSLLATGTEGLTELLLLRTEPNWAVRREVVSALGMLGDVALPPLCRSLVQDRDDETRIAATVDALVASAGDVGLAIQSLLSADSAGASVPVGAAENPAVLADIAQILGRRRDRASIPMLAQLAEHADDNVAVGAIEALGRIGGRAVVDVLLRAIDSGRFFRTFAAIDVLGKSGDPRAIAPLVQLLDSAYCSFEAIRALGRTGDRAAIPALARLLAAPAAAQVRAAAAAISDLRQTYGERLGTALPIEEALRRASPSGATRRLIHCLSGADNAEQLAIFVVLGALRDAAAVPALLRALDVNPALGPVAVTVLKQLAVDSEAQLVGALIEGNSARRETLLPTLSRSLYADAVAACLLDGAANVRRLACEALARIGNPSVLAALFAALSDTSPAVVQAAISAITSLGCTETTALATAAAASASATVRRAALRILAYSGSPESLPTFEQATRDDDPRVRGAAIQGLALLESPAAIELLLALTRNQFSGVRANAVRALGDTRAELAIGQQLTRALTDTDPWVRYYACQSLGKLRVESSLPAIAELVQDEAGQVRVAAIEALSHFSNDAAFETLCQTARSSDIDQQRAALIGLGLSGRIEGVAVLLSHVSSPDAASRLIAISALANFDTAETLSALKQATSDVDESVRAAAVAFLGGRTGTEATRVLIELLKEGPLLERTQTALLVPQAQRVVGLSKGLQTADEDQAQHITNILARLDRPDATAALFEALTLPNSAARKAAATTLAALGSNEALAALRRLTQTDADLEVRRICLLLLAQ